MRRDVKQLALLAASCLLLGCSDDERDFSEPTGGAGGAGGDSGSAGDAGSGGKGTGGSSGKSGAGGGGTGAVAGAAGQAGAAGNGACGTTYSDWFRSTFAFPDGGILGTADFPSTPWKTVAGMLSSSSSRAAATGGGVAIASQGALLQYSGTRLRFKFVLSNAEQALTVAFNADAAGAGGLSVRVAGATGELSVAEKGRALGSEPLGALELDTEYYVNLTIDGGTARVDMSTINFAGVPGSALVGGLDVEGLLQDTTGSFASIALEGTGVAVDSVSISRCGVPAPSYTPLFLDSFDRADGTDFGGPELPTGLTWTRSGTDPAEISANALRLTDNVSLYTAPQHFPNRGLRVRTKVRFGTLGWLVVYYNYGSSGESPNGFDVWREEENSVFIEYPRGDPFGRTAFMLDTSTFYFIEFNVDEDVAVTTFRSSSYEGPILFGFQASEVSEAPAGQNELYLSNTWGGGSLTIDEFRIDRYAP